MTDERMPWDEDPTPIPTDEEQEIASAAAHDAAVRAFGLDPAIRHRIPYVGDGAEGALRSAEIDRTELEGLDQDDSRVPELRASIDAWEAQATALAQADAAAEAILAAACDPVPLPYRVDTRTVLGVVDERADPPPELLEGPAILLRDRVDLQVDGLLDDLADSARRAITIGKIEDGIRHAVRTRADARRKARTDRLAGDQPSSEGDVRREAIGAADDSEILAAFAGAFTAGANEAKQIAGELLDELPGRGGKPRASLKVADGEGFQLAVTRTKRTETSIKLEEVVDVVVAREAAFAAAATGADPETGPTALKIHPAKVYATGLRAGIDAILELLTSPSFKVTALDALVKSLEDADDDDLARRLRKAYGRVEKGEPTIKLERKPLPETCAECGRAKGEHRVSCSLRVAKVDE